MANTKRGEVDFRVDKDTYTLSYSVNALCELEEALGIGIVEIANLLGDKDRLKLSTIRHIFHVGLKDYHPSVSITDTGKIMTDLGIEKVVELFSTAFGLAFPEAEASRPLGKDNGKRAGTG